MNKDKKISKLEKNLNQSRKNTKIFFYLGSIIIGTLMLGFLGAIGGLIFAFSIDCVYSYKNKGVMAVLEGQIVIIDDINGIFRQFKYLSESRFEILEIITIAGVNRTDKIFEYKIVDGEILVRLLDLESRGIVEVQDNCVLKEKIKERSEDSPFSDLDIKRILKLEEQCKWHREEDGQIINLIPKK